MDLVLRKVKFHGILEDQRDILSHRCRIRQVFVLTVQLSSISNVVETHWRLDDFCVIGNYVLNRILENEILIFL